MNPYDILKLVLFVAVAAWVSSAARSQGIPPAIVVAAEVVEGEVAAEQSFVATVLPLKRAVVGSSVDGRVVELVAQEGERVEKNQPLVQLLTETIELELAAAAAELDLRREELAELEHGSRPNEIEQAKARMLGAKASMEYAQSRRKRTESLQGSNAVSQDDLHESQSAAARAEQSYYEFKAAYDLAVEGPRPERIAQARARLAQQQALVDQIADRVKKHTIISRFDGYIVAEHVEQGVWIQSGDPVMEVVSLDEVEVEAFVVEQHAAHVRPGMHVRVEVPALPDRLFSGVVSTVVPQADTRARTFPVKVLVQNEISDTGPLLKAGMYARVALPVGSPRQAVMVPKDALVLGGPQPLVYVVDETAAGQGKVQAVPVAVGVALPDLIQVTGSVKAGQLVVVQGNERLRPGQDVVITRVVRPKLAGAAGQ